MATPGYSSKCRACNSAHRAEIDRRLLAGESARAVAEWLAAAGERLSFVALANHKAAHLDVTAEAAKIVEASVPAFNAAVEKVVADVGVLNEVASIGLRVAKALEAAVSSGKITQPVATAFGAALSNARAAVTERHEILYGKKLEVTNVGSSEDDAEDLHRRAAAALAAATGGAGPGAVGEPPAGPAG